MAAAIVMFALSTADFSLTLRLQLVDVPKFIRGETNLNEVIRRNVPKSQLFVANKWIYFLSLPAFLADDYLGIA